MTIKRFLEMDYIELNELTRKENRPLAEETLREMASRANVKLERLSKLNIPSPAFASRTIIDSDGYATKGYDGKFLYEEFLTEIQSTGKNEDQDLRKIRRELKYVQAFLRGKTSTVKGAKEYFRDITERVNRTDKFDRGLANNYEKSKEFWSAYDKLQESEFNLLHNIIGSGDTQAIIQEIQSKGYGGDLKDYATELMQEIRDIAWGKYDSYSPNDYKSLKKNRRNEYDKYKEARRIYNDILGRKFHPTPKA